MATKKPRTEQNYTYKDIAVRLDAIIRLLIEANSNKEKFNNTNIIPILNGIGLEPIHIAKIFGKNKATDVAPYLYKKNKKVNSKA